MKKLKKFVASPAVTMASLVLAIGLLLFSTIGGARAALTYYSDNYVSDVQLQQIAVALLENGEVVAEGTSQARAANVLLGWMNEKDFQLHLGQTYPEVLAVQNPVSTDDTENIGQYVRVTVQKYWEVQGEAGSEKAQELKPDLIDLNLTNLRANGSSEAGWVQDTSAYTNTAERTVLYYNRPLGGDNPNDPRVSVPFADTLTISPDAALYVDKTVETQTTTDGSKTVVTTTYVYENATFQIKVTVDAVQQHNAEDAIFSAWGRQVNIASDGTLSLADLAE